MNDLIDGVQVEGDVLFDGQPIFRPSQDVTALREAGVVARPLPRG